MKILLLGANGQLGAELSCFLPSVGKVKACDRSEVDLTNTQSSIKAIQTFQPDVIINAAAYTAVDRAESEQELAYKVNAEAVSVLAEETKKSNAWLINYSTDYVFDGTKKSPYVETDIPNPVNTYGKSKLAGEKAIQNSGCRHLIFRTSWVMGKVGNNFLKTIIRLAQERKDLRVINDQYGVPTTTSLITRVTTTALNSLTKSPWPIGIYHLTSQGKTTWYDIAKTLLQLCKKNNLHFLANEKTLKPIRTSQYPTPAQRPANSLLDTAKLEQCINYKLPDWNLDILETANSIISGLK